MWLYSPPSDETIAVLPSPSPRGIRFINLPSSEFWPSQARPTDVWWSEGRLNWFTARHRAVSIDLRQLTAVTVWQPQPLTVTDWTRRPYNSAAWRHSWAELRLLRPTVPVWHDEAAQALAAAIKRADADGLVGSVARLVGCGSGLTPHGDDVVAGAAAVLPQDWRDLVASQVSRGATSSLSYDLLQDALAGYLLEPAMLFVQAVCAGDRSGATAALVRLCRIGQSSGAAIAFGVLVGLSFGSDLS